MSEFNIEVQGGSSVRLPTAGKYCEKDIIVTASGGGGNGTEEIENLKILYNNLRQISFQNNINMPETIEIDCSNLISLASCFEATRGLKTVLLKNTQKSLSISRILFNTLIETIGILDLSGINPNGGLTNAFNSAPSLTNIEFVSNTIPASIRFSSALLSPESIQSIIDGLAYVTTAQTLTLSQSITVTDEQKLTISNKGWTLVQ